MMSSAGHEGADGLEEVPRVVFEVTMADGVKTTVVAMCAEVHDGALVFSGAQHRPEFLVAAFSAGSWKKCAAEQDYATGGLIR